MSRRHRVLSTFPSNQRQNHSKQSKRKAPMATVKLTQGLRWEILSKLTAEFRNRANAVEKQIVALPSSIFVILFAKSQILVCQFIPSRALSVSMKRKNIIAKLFFYLYQHSRVEKLYLNFSSDQCFYHSYCKYYSCKKLQRSWNMYIGLN